VKLCDFGIAKSYEGLDDRADDQELPLGMVEGKAGYMSPEQARGEPLDGRADVFAAGIILWELLTGRKLYKAGDGESLFDIARRGAVKPLPELGLPSEHALSAILERALARNREDRYASAEELLADIERYALRAKLVTGATALPLSRSALRRRGPHHAPPPRAGHRRFGTRACGDHHRDSAG
jgi:serine/threonine-protein kinase